LKEAFGFLGINFSARELMNIALSKQAGKAIFKTDVGVQLNLLHFDKVACICYWYGIEGAVKK